MALPKVTAGQLADLLGGELVGDPAAVIDRFSPIHEAGPGAVTFISNKKYYPALKVTQARRSSSRPKDIDRLDSRRASTLLIHENPYLALARGMQLWFQQPRPTVGRTSGPTSRPPPASVRASMSGPLRI